MGERGFLLGKFLPPHRGHEYLIRFAQAWMGEAPLTVLLCSLPGDPIPGELRLRWLRELAPAADLRHCTELLPQEPADHPEFWAIWRRVCHAHCASPPTRVFASEAYGQRLATELGASFVPVDIGREMVPSSGTAVRADPLARWEDLPEAVRPHFVKRVAVLGPESSGKTTLARQLAERFETVWVHEWARPFYDWKGLDIQPEDLPLIARGQDAAIHARERLARRVLISDTDGLTTCVWSELLFGVVDPTVEAIALAQRIDLSLVLEPDLPWVDDSQRVMPELAQRQRFVERLCQRLDQLGRRYQRIGGSSAQRCCSAEAAVNALLA
jgi:HTH-type transcriptional repressor of NAD biosynthesis genes